MAPTCKESAGVHIKFPVQIILAVFTLVAWMSLPASARPHKLEDEATARCENLLPDQTAAVTNGVYVPPGGIRSVPVSRAKPTTVQLVVTGEPLNRALNAVYTVPIARKLVNAPRLLFVLELKCYKSCLAGSICSGGQMGDLCLRTLSLLGYFGFQKCPVKEALIGFASSAMRAGPLSTGVQSLAPELTNIIANT